MNIMNMKKIIALTFLVVTVLMAPAATMSLDLIQPAVDVDDVSNLVGAAADQDNVGTATADGGANDQTTYIAFDRPAQGQIFLTPSLYPVYQVDAVTVQHAGYTSNTDVTYYYMVPGSQFTIRVTDPSQSGSTGVVLDSETYTISGSEANIFAADGAINTPNGTGTWVTFTFDTPVTLQANTLYGFDIRS